MNYDPQKIMGKADGIVINEAGKTVGMFWENPVTKDMTKAERAAYWKDYDARKK